MLITLLILNLVLSAILYVTFKKAERASGTRDGLDRLSSQIGTLDVSISERLRSANADLAARLEGAKGDLRQEVADRLAKGFREIRESVDGQLSEGRREQADHLLNSRSELTQSLARTTSELKVEFDGLNQRTAQSLEAIRDRVDTRLIEITNQVQEKLDHNIK